MTQEMKDVAPEHEPCHRRFFSITRTPCGGGTFILDAIDEDGQAWWLTVNTDPDTPWYRVRKQDEWVKLKSLPKKER